MTRRAALLALPALTLAVLAPLAPAAPSKSQEFFREKLLADRGTSEEIVDLLRTGGGFVTQPVRFADLTGDDRADAVVRVSSGGAAGVVALYVFTADGGKQLRVAYRAQRLQRATLRIDDDKVRYRTSAYAEGDELCCPSVREELVLTWTGRRFKVAERKDVSP